MKLSELMKGITADIQNDKDITSVAYDSRKVKSGSVFVCIKGFKTDGHEYASQASQNGAAVIVAQDKINVPGVDVVYVEDTRKALAVMSGNFYGNPSKRFKLIGITGTNGKTTTTYLIKSILEMAGQKVGLIGTNQNMIGDSVLPSEHTTPESLELQELFYKMADCGADTVVMEVSSHSLVLNRVYGCDFDVGVFTNITQDHLDFHETMENYLEAKKKLFAMSETAVVNIDDPCGTSVVKASSGRVITYGIDKSCDLRACDVRLSARGVIFDILKKNIASDIRVQLAIPGKFSVYNALAAIGGARALGIDFDTIVKGLRVAKGVKGRAEVVPTNTDYTILIDYAHTPDGLYNIITTVREIAKGRVVTLFGCGGDRDRTKRPLMGEMAGKLSDFCIVTSDNPRSENPMSIIEDILPGINSTGCEYKVIENRKEAIEFAIENAQPDDMIILAGKGHETYQILADKTIEFDERKIIHGLLDKR